MKDKAEKKEILPIIFGIASTSLSDEEIDFFKRYPIEGIILFSRNIQSREQLIALNKSIKELYEDRPDLPIFVDQEGGRVARIKPPVAQKEYPAAEHFANMYETDKDKAICGVCDNYIQIMSEARGLGFDSLCSPVCDLLFEGASNVIGDRSFGANPDKVVALAGAAIDGIIEAGGIPFIKHLPGHGRALVDSHYELPYVDTELSELEQTDFMPFKKLGEKDVWAMTAHIIYKSIDPSSPITLSKNGIDYIRKNIFDGKIVTDDVGMFALHDEVGIKKSLLRRLAAALKSEDTDRIVTYKENYGDLVSKKFGIRLDKMSIVELQKILPEYESSIKNDFLFSLADVSKRSIESGCDTVLHCSGDMEEMQAIVDVLS